MSDQASELGSLWAVHSSTGERPALRAWAASEAEANEKMQQLQKSDPTPEDSYWVTQLTHDAIETLKGNGFIPKDA